MIKLVENRSLSFEALRRACIDNDWFTDGSNSQYEKLFDLNDAGASIKDLSLVIWVCSENVTREEILETLLNIQDRLIGE